MTSTTKRKTVGLALSGGGARGFAHVGVVKALTDNGIPIDCVAGTSAGSFVGAAVAAGLSADEIYKFGEGLNWFKISRPPYSMRALLSNAGMKTFIEKHFELGRFEDLKIPFAAVACDLETCSEVVLKDEGDLITAIRASCAIPGVFTPVEDDQGRMLVDGGVVAPMPIDALKQFGPDIIVAVDLMASGNSFISNPRTLVGMLFQSSMVMLRSISRAQHFAADVVIVPQIAHIRLDQMGKMDELYKLGLEAGLAKVPEIQRLLEVHQNALPSV
jgi:NTE family protein